jgi:hypothetical protein
MDSVMTAVHIQHDCNVNSVSLYGLHSLSKLFVVSPFQVTFTLLLNNSCYRETDEKRCALSYEESAIFDHVHIAYGTP